MAAVLGALTLQMLLTGFTPLFPGEEGTYGAPFSQVPRASTYAARWQSYVIDALREELGPA